MRCPVEHCWLFSLLLSEILNSNDPLNPPTGSTSITPVWQLSEHETGVTVVDIEMLVSEFKAAIFAVVATSISTKYELMFSDPSKSLRTERIVALSELPSVMLKHV